MRTEELRTYNRSDRATFPCRPLASRPSWILANGLSASRLFVCVPVVVALLRNSPSGDLVALALMSWAFVSDIVDGQLARKTGSRSQFGAVLDPVADKILIGCIVITLVLVRSLPVWAAGAIVTRDLCILAVGGWLVRRKGKVLESNSLGKVTGVVFAFMIAFYTLRLETYGFLLAVLSVGLVILSSVFYSARLLRLLKGGSNETVGIPETD